MKHKSPPEDQASPQHTVDGPGSQLRKARERKGLDQSKLAAQLHLSQALIQALEWDDYEKLPAAVFVQGYLRNYARILEVDEEAVIAAYQELQPDAGQQPLARNQPDQVAQDLHTDHRLSRYITLIVLLALGVLVFFWWQGRMDTAEPPVAVEEERSVIEPAFAPEPVEEASLAPVAPLPALGEDETATAPESPSEPAASLADTPMPEEPPLTAARPDELTGTAPETPLGQAPERAPEARLGQEPEAPTESLEAADAPAAAAPGLLVFEFTGPCWVEVRDASGRARIIGVMQAGMSRRLAASLGPFRVVIGDIHAVSLSVNGEAYDLGRHTRGKVARFTLAPSRL